MSAGREAETAAPGIGLVGQRRSPQHDLVAAGFRESSNDSVLKPNSRSGGSGYRHQHSAVEPGAGAKVVAEPYPRASTDKSRKLSVAH